MTAHEQEREEKKEQEVGGGKRPYQTPKLKRLGKVEQLTQGIHVTRIPDFGGASF